MQMYLSRQRKIGIQLADPDAALGGLIWSKKWGELAV
jgi:hypothetical protein